MNETRVLRWKGNGTMDKYEFMCMVDDIFDECETKEQMDSRLKEMRNIIQQQYILKIGFKQTMRELK